jgi:hypothetical protein
MKEIEKINAYCFALIGICRETNAETMTLEQKKVTHFGKDIGDWEVVVRKLGGREWLIWSNEHNAWWGHGQRGYVADVRVAGRYTREEAVQIVHEANIGVRLDPESQPNEAMVHVSVVEKRA